MWIQIEGKPRPIQVDIKQSEYATKRFNLDRLATVLKDDFSNKFPELQNVGLNDIEFLHNNDRMTPLDSGMILTNDNTTSKNPLVVRYPLSESRSK